MPFDTSSNTQRSDRDHSAAIGFSIYVTAPRVLHIDSDADTALVLSALLVPETRVTHVTTIAAAQDLLLSEQFAESDVIYVYPMQVTEYYLLVPSVDTELPLGG